MKDTVLVIMAASIGSRFGGGIKQLEPVEPGGEIIMNHSIRDAMETGFNKVISVIRRDLEKDSKEIIGHRIKELLPVEYAYQELQDLPAGYEMTPGRTKPWGAGRAILSVKGTVDGPFLMINTDNYYGRGGSRRIHSYMAEHMDSQSEVYDIYMGGFVLSNALSDNGTATRGVCQADGDRFLTNVAETHNIQMREDGLHTTDESGVSVTISPSQSVSMSMWGLPASFVQELERGFLVFLDSLKEGGIKSEYLLPKITGNLVQNKRARVTVLGIPNKWFGVTYRGDKQAVTDTIRGSIESGVYEEKLFG